MSIAMPETITYGKVVGRFIQGIDDTLDVDLLPDIVPIVGRVTFMPVTRLMKETSASPPTTFARPVMSALIGATGLLTSPAGDVGIWLISGDYKVSYELDGVTIPSHDIVVLAEHTDVLPLDLTLAIPPGGPLMSASQYAELVSRVSVIEMSQAAVLAAEAAAEAAAVAAAATAATAAAAAVAAADAAAAAAAATTAALAEAMGIAAATAAAEATVAAEAAATAAAAAQVAAEAAQAAALATSLLFGSPVDVTVETLVSTLGTATRTALDADFADKASETDARTPTAHAASHAPDGSDPLAGGSADIEFLGYMGVFA